MFCDVTQTANLQQKSYQNVKCNVLLFLTCIDSHTNTSGLLLAQQGTPKVLASSNGRVALPHTSYSVELAKETGSQVEVIWIKK